MAPEAFDAAAARLAAIVHSSDDAIVSKDLDGTIVSWNPAAERMFGYTAAEAVGRSIRLIVPADRQAEEDHVLASIRAGTEVAHFETVRVRKDGSLIPISLTVSPVLDGAGRVIGASKIARDISDRREAEAALARTDAARVDLERRLMALVAASSTVLMSPVLDDVMTAIFKLAAELVPADALAVWRRDTARRIWRIEWAENLSDDFKAHEVASVSPDDVLREPLAVSDVSASPAMAARWIEYDREGIKSLLAVPVVQPDAPSTLVFYHRSPHTFDRVEVQTAAAVANMASAAIGAARLFEAQRRSRLDSDFLARAGSLLSSSLEYEETLARVADLAVPYFADWCGVDLVDPHGQSLRLALAHVDPRRIAFARAFMERYPEDPNSPYSVARVIKTGQAVVLDNLTDDDIARGARDEAHRQAIMELDVRSFMIVPLQAHGRTFGAITFAAGRDRRRYGRSDLLLAQQLADRAAIAVDNARAYEEARRANSLKDDFIATLSHELRTPLNALVGYARMLRRGLIPSKDNSQAFEVLDRNATALTNIVNDIFDMSRVSSGKLRLNVRRTDVSALVSQCMEAIEDVARSKPVRVEISLPREPVKADVDPDRLQQVVWNLMSNGVKFTPAGGRIDVSVTPADASGRIALTVSDTGIGIAPDFLPHVFDRFRQGDTRLTREHGGLGLGLAIVRHLVELHGGTVEATSLGIGLGATFVVRVPVSQAVTRGAVADAPEASAAGAPEPVQRLKGTHVLVVDDDSDALSMIRQVLEAAGARVTSTNSPLQALALAEAGADVLLSDIGMPGQDGLQLLSRIRALSQNRGLPAAALTALSRPEDRDRALSAGFQAFLSKPIDPEDLVLAVSALAHPAPH
jgi:PAS domain S-box-containing protein